MIEKAREAITRFNLWGLSTTLLRLSWPWLAQGTMASAPHRLPKAAEAMLNVVYDPLIHRFVDDISSSGKALEKLDELKAYRDNLVTKLALEFTEAEKND